MTPANTAPVCMPNLSSSDLSSEHSCLMLKISDATRTRRPKAPLWPVAASRPSRWSSGVTPTAQTYSSRTVSIFVTPCLSQMLSNSKKCAFRNSSNFSGDIFCVIESKSSMTRKRTVAHSMRTAMHPPGSRSIGVMTKAGTMYSSKWNILRLSSVCLSSSIREICSLSSMFHFLMSAKKFTQHKKMTVKKTSNLALRSISLVSC
mmetsp:Transcript_7336/g.26715  ORF Transcript_7336/g.26715 Transcript_7336/m.26715 type:complete len:204 (-) Transcript_7336:1348-1959(-)